MKKLFAILLAICLLWGCTDPAAPADNPVTPDATEATARGEPAEVSDLKVEELFSDRDLRTEYEADGTITLRGDTAVADAKNVAVDGGVITVTGEGVFEVTGTLNNGMLLVDAQSEKVQLVLKNAHITNETGAAIYVRRADKVFLTLVGENTLQNGGSFTAIDDQNIDAVIYARDDLTLNGSGGLAVVAPAGHGISAKDELTVTGGSLTVDCAGHALDANDSIAIADGSFVLTAGKDGIHAENNEDAALGFVYVKKGSFVIDAQGDGISAGSAMQLEDGTYTITTGGGAVNGQKQTSDGWGGFGGGRPGGPGGRGGFEGQAAETTEDSTSIKGIKAGGELVISGGSFTIDSADDAVHSNGAVTVSGGSFAIATGDDGFHADEALIVNGGTFRISESYEGLEGKSVTVAGGDIRLVSSDDGLNAAGGNDGSGFGGRGGDMFGGRGAMGGGASDSFIIITGGTLYVQASGDGIDANGTLEITGGFTTVCGPTQGDTAVLDYDISATITGGTFIGTGSQMMAQTFSDSQQGVIALRVGDQSAGTNITLTDEGGNTLINYAPELNYEIVILSTPDMKKGEVYTVAVGVLSDSFSAS